MNYNTWLVQNGFMTLKGGDGSRAADLEMLFGQGEFWPNVDWSKTKAYAMGLGDIYINLKGREGKGCVSPGAEYEAVRDEIRKKLVTLVDPKTGQRAVSRIFTREEAYGSFDADVIPDLIVTNTAGTRIGWQGSLGVVSKEMFEDNNQVWSGDHCSLDPAVVPGILFANRALPKDKQPGIADVPATISRARDHAARKARRGAALLRRSPRSRVPRSRRRDARAGGTCSRAGPRPQPRRLRRWRDLRPPSASPSEKQSSRNCAAGSRG